MNKWLVFVIILLLLAGVVNAVKITSDPDEASVYVLGMLKGKTPLDIELSKISGIRVSLKDYKDVTRVVAPEEKEVHFALSPLQEFQGIVVNTIRVDSVPSDAELYLNGIFKGKTPKLLEHLIVGKDYTLKLSKKGYEDYVYPLTLTGKDVVNVMARLVPLASVQQKAPEPPKAKMPEAPVQKAKPAEKEAAPEFTRIVKREIKETIPSAPRARMSFVTITSEPEGASVYVMSKLKGVTPLTLELPAGRSRVKLSLNGYKDLPRVVYGTEGNVHFVLSPLKEKEALTNTLKIESEPSGAYVYLNGVLKGTTPRVLDHITVGKEYSIKITKKGYKDYTVVHTLTGEEINKIVAKLERIITEAEEEEEPVAEPTLKKPTILAKIKHGEATTEDISFGTLFVASKPAGANVFVDGELIGQTPVSAEVMSIKYHEVKIAMDGYHDYYTRKSIDPEQTASVEAVLIALPTKDVTGDIYVSSRPQDADIYVDGVHRGTTPYTLKGITIGPHKIKVSKEGYNDFVVTKTINANRILNIGAVLLPSRRIVEKGELIVKASENEAVIYADGAKIGEAPQTIALEGGNHVIEVRKDGFRDYIATIQIVAGKKANLLAKLIAEKPQVTEGSLDVRSVPRRAQVFVNGEDKGKTPLTLKRVHVGEYDVRVVLAGYKEYATTAKVEPGKTASVWTYLKK